MQKTIRIFLSSTFTDTKVDRNELMEEVFEPIKDLCQQHGIAFEVVDLRWGKSAVLTFLSVSCTNYIPILLHFLLVNTRSAE